jgi:hypothetical protein
VQSRFNYRIACLVAVLTLVFGLTLPASAQRYLGSIQGEVTDSTGAKVGGAVVTAEETGTHFKSTVTSNGSGTYTFAALNPGTYTVTATASGFKMAARNEVTLTAGQLQQVDFDLSLGETTETVTVTGSSSLLDTGSANIATTISAQEVSDLPNEGRNPYNLATLAVGVVGGNYFQSKSSQFTNPFSGVAVQIVSGGSAGHNRLTLNGIPNDPPERLSGATYAGFTPSNEAVQEVKIGTSAFDAQVGHGNGTVTNVVVRGGTNKIHGAAYYVFQNTYLNANLYERVPNQDLCYPGSAGCTNTTAPTRRNNDQLSQTGFVVDGPVFIPKIYDGRDKTFFMVAFERYASHTAINYNTLVPTAAQIAGDFSGLCTAFNGAGLCTNGRQIYDPLSPIDINGNRTAFFANNKIPTARFNTAGTNLLSYFPQPNVALNSAGTVNYISSKTSYPSTYPSIIGRLDHKISEKNTLSAIMFRAGLTQNYPLQGFPKGIGPYTSSTGYGYNVYRNTRGGSVDDIHQFSSSLLLDSRLGVVWHPFGLVYPGSSNFDLSGLGISSAGLPYSTFPGITGTSDGYAGLSPGANGQISTSLVGSLSEILTKTIGRHSIRLGYEGNLIHYNVQNPQSGFGGFSFSRVFTQKNYATGDSSSGDSTAALLLGDFTSGSYNITPAYALRQLYNAGFIQDDWRVSSRLTLNLGVRYDYESPFTERYNKQVTNFCTTCVNPAQAGVAGLTLNGGLQYASSTNRFPYSPDYNNIQPRAGMAFQVSQNTVLRAGYGMIYFNTLENPIGTGFSQSTTTNNANVNLPITTLSNPFPNGVLLPTGSSLGLASAVGTNITFVDPNHVQPRTQQLTVNVQQQFPGNIQFQVGYVNNRPSQLEVSQDINALPQQYYSTGTDPQTNLNNQVFLNANVANPMFGKLPATANSNLTQSTIQRQLLLRPFPEFGSVTKAYQSIGYQRYDALQVQVSRPMKNHFSVQGSFTWNKLISHTSFLNNFGPGSVLSGLQDAGPSLFGNVFATFALPKFEARPYYQRVVLGGWKLNTVMRASNGNLISAPGGVDQIGDPMLGSPRTFQRMFNTCYQTVSAATVGGVANTAVVSTVNTGTGVTACDGTSNTAAYRTRFSYTIQTNSPYINERQRIYPLVDLSMFKQFIIHEGVSFEIRGEFFNVGNRPNFGGPGTGLSSASYGAVTLTQANDARQGQLTARINF